MGAPGGADELGRSEAVEASFGVVAEQTFEAAAQCVRGNVAEPSLARQDGRQPFFGAVQQHLVIEPRDRCIEPVREGRPRAELRAALVPRQ